MAQSNPLENLYTEELYAIKPKVLIVIASSWSSLQDDEVNLLTKILNAVKLSLSSVQVVTRSAFAVEDFKTFQPSHIISFGAMLKNNTSLYQAIQVNDTSVVLADELRNLDDARKKNLWLTLKQVFHA